MSRMKVIKYNKWNGYFSVAVINNYDSLTKIGFKHKIYNIGKIYFNGS